MANPNAVIVNIRKSILHLRWMMPLDSHHLNSCTLRILVCIYWEYEMTSGERVEPASLFTTRTRIIVRDRFSINPIAHCLGQVVPSDEWPTDTPNNVRILSITLLDLCFPFEHFKKMTPEQLHSHFMLEQGERCQMNGWYKHPHWSYMSPSHGLVASPLQGDGWRFGEANASSRPWLWIRCFRSCQHFVRRCVHQRAGSPAADSQRGADHEEGAAAERQDLETSQGDNAGVCIRVHRLHHGGSCRQLPEEQPQDHQRRRHLRRHEDPWPRRLRWCHEKILAQVQGAWREGNL